MQHRNMFKEADEFLAQAAKDDPERWSELEDSFPTLSKHDYRRIKNGEPNSRNRKRRGSAGGPPRQKRKFLETDEWEELRRARARYAREWEEDFKYAKELADEGM